MKVFLGKGISKRHVRRTNKSNGYEDASIERRQRERNVASLELVRAQQINWRNSKQFLCQQCMRNTKEYKKCANEAENRLKYRLIKKLERFDERFIMSSQIQSISSDSIQWTNTQNAKLQIDDR